MTSLFETAVLPLFEEHRQPWVDRARAAAVAIGRKQSEVTIDDVRDACPPPADVDPRVLGAVFRRGQWKRVGYRQSTRAACHNRPVAVWTLVA